MMGQENIEFKRAIAELEAYLSDLDKRMSKIFPDWMLERFVDGVQVELHMNDLLKRCESVDTEEEKIAIVRADILAILRKNGIDVGDGS
jgi:hypothetical protein